MGKLYIVKDEVLKIMKEEISSNIQYYKDASYPDFKLEELTELRGLSIDDDLEENLLAILSVNGQGKMFEVAKTLFEGLEISPLLASSEALWVYLTHGPLKKVTSKIWDFSQLKANDSEEKYVMYHWFLKSSSVLMRNALASLWWGVKISIIESDSDPYRLSRLFFSNYTLRIVSLAQVLRMPEVLRGILEWLATYRDNDDRALENRGKFIAKYLNQLSGVKQLSVLDHNQIYALLEEVKDVILKIKSREDVENKTTAEIIQEKRFA